MSKKKKNSQRGDKSRTTSAASESRADLPSLQVCAVQPLEGDSSRKRGLYLKGECSGRRPSRDCGRPRADGSCVITDVTDAWHCPIPKNEISQNRVSIGDRADSPGSRHNLLTNRRVSSSIVFSRESISFLSLHPSRYLFLTPLPASISHRIQTAPQLRHPTPVPNHPAFFRFSPFLPFFFALSAPFSPPHRALHIHLSILYPTASSDTFTHAIIQQRKKE